MRNNKMKFYITDVFGESKYSGNQLATYRCESPLATGEMQKIAHEINFSESTFILSEEQENGGYNVRIFTPTKEVDFAGHPVLGTAYIIRQHIIKDPVQRVIINLKIGQIPVTFTGHKNEILWMEQIEPTFGKVLEIDNLSKILNIPKDAFDTSFPIQEVSTGLPHIIVPLKKLKYLKSAKVSKELYFKFIYKTWAKNILIFCPESYTNSHDMSVRMFADYLGIPEDPATGSGNGCLAGYLIKYRYFKSAEIEIKIGQGYEINRPSLLLLRAKEHDSQIKISVGGKVIPIAEGQWS
jgi:trans-2,3-dihydro-3-hydroxyanthranilate isomerase